MYVDNAREAVIYEHGPFCTLPCVPGSIWDTLEVSAAQYDAINKFTRAKMSAPSFFRQVFPPRPLEDTVADNIAKDMLLE